MAKTSVILDIINQQKQRSTHCEDSYPVMTLNRHHRRRMKALERAGDDTTYRYLADIRIKDR